MNDFSIGRVFTDWETDGVLGSGTFGTVYLAHTAVENKPVYAAVKVIKIPPNDEAIENAEKLGISRDLLKTYFGKFKSDLNWESTMYNTVASQHLVKNEEISIEDLPEAGWVGYIRTGVYTPMEVYFDKVESASEDAARLGFELSSALAALEGNNLVHGDIRPENVMVSDNGSFLLSDFAIKRCLEKAGANLFGAISNEFEAPELKDGEKKYSAASDIYSLGMLMSYVANNCALTVSGKPEDVAGLDPKLAEVIKKAAAERPEDRYASAAELNKAIAALDIYKNRRPQRRAVAAAASFELVKKNGSTIRGETREKTEEKPQEKIKFPNDPIEARKKKRRGIAGKIIAAVLTVAAVAALVWFVAADPAGIIRNLTNPDSVVHDIEGETGDITGDKDNEGKEFTVIEHDPEKKPDEGAAAPDEGTTPPDEGTAPPDEGTTPPDEGTTPPDEGTTPPDSSSDDPNVIDGPDNSGTEPATEDEYLFPSDTRLIDYSELEGLGKNEALLALNEIYARHGRAFKTDWIREYFESQSWYKATEKTDAQINKELSKTENDNIKTMNQYLKDKGYR